MKITEHFTLEELTYSSTGIRRGLKNQPNDSELANIRKTAEKLEIMRDWLCRKYGREVSIKVTSCFRSDAVNKAVGGSATSAHRYGSAADINASGLTSRQLAQDIIKMRDEGVLTFDQLILEFEAWVHFGCRHNSDERNQILTAVKRGGKTVYLNGLQ